MKSPIDFDEDTLDLFPDLRRLTFRQIDMLGTMGLSLPYRGKKHLIANVGGSPGQSQATRAEN